MKPLFYGQKYVGDAILKAADKVGIGGNFALCLVSIVPLLAISASSCLTAALVCLPGAIADGVRAIGGSFWIYGPFISEGGKAKDGKSSEFKNEVLLLPNQKLSK